MAIGELTDIFHWVLKRACNPIECFVLSRRTFSASFNSTWSYVQVKEISNLLKRWTCVMAWYFDVISDSFWLSFVFFVIIVVVFFSGYSVPFVLRLTSTNLFIFCICQTVPIVFHTAKCSELWVNWTTPLPVRLELSLNWNCF